VIMHEENLKRSRSAWRDRLLEEEIVRRVDQNGSTGQADGTAKACGVARSGREALMGGFSTTDEPNNN